MESEYLSHIFYDLYRHANDDYKKAQHQNEKRFSKEYQLRICHAYKYVDWNEYEEKFIFVCS